MVVLGIETSCDETAAAIVDGDCNVRSNIVSSQLEHAQYGGVVPELASRAHVKAIVPTIQEALGGANLNVGNVTGIAVTRGPGLSGSLVVGLSAAKAMAVATSSPLIGIHHMEGHVFSNLIEHDVTFPLLALLVSGGHTELVTCPTRGEYRLLGRTRDDAAGEAFDKVAKILKLLPSTGAMLGGPVVAELADMGNPNAISFPRAMGGHDSLDFSFSGLKTAVLNHVRSLDDDELAMSLPDVAASFQAAVVDVLVDKTTLAMKKTGIRSVAVAGGVAANRRLRRNLEQAVASSSGELFYPSPILCTDNAAMIAAAGLFRLSRGERSSLDIDVAPRLEL